MRAHFNKHSDAPLGSEYTLKVLSIRDKISKLNTSLSLKDTFYLEFKFVKEEPVPLKLKDFDYNSIKGVTITLKD